LAVNKLSISSGAVIQGVPGSLIPVFSYINPEIILTKMLSDYLGLMNLPNLYSNNLGAVRVSGVHPFALLMFAQDNSTEVPTGLFPSVTITDTSDQDSFELLAYGEEAGLIDSSAVNSLAEGVAEDSIILAPANLAALQTATANGAQISVRRYKYISTHDIMFSIWHEENKEVVNQLYDICKSFLIIQLSSIKKAGVGITGGVGGRRSGDVSTEFGRLLYGASINIRATIEIDMMICYIGSGPFPTNFVVEPTVRVGM